LIAAEGAPVRRLLIGAELQPGGGVDFRLWAPRWRKVVVEIEGLEPETLQAETGGYFSLWSQLARVGMRYRFRLDRRDLALPDPALVSTGGAARSVGDYRPQSLRLDRRRVARTCS
jgi:1,4-alpha-glucan branching enzyme